MILLRFAALAPPWLSWVSDNQTIPSSSEDMKSGIRMALSAQQNDVRQLVLHESETRACLNVAIGLLGALALTRLMRGFLYVNWQARDPIRRRCWDGDSANHYVTCSPSYFPAWRAMRVDPVLLRLTRIRWRD